MIAIRMLERKRDLGVYDDVDMLLQVLLCNTSDVVADNQALLAVRMLERGRDLGANANSLLRALLNNSLVSQNTKSRLTTLMRQNRTPKKK